MKSVAIVLAACLVLFLSTDTKAEVVFVSAGFDLKTPDYSEFEPFLRSQNQGSMSRDGSSVYGTFDWFWLVPKARWLWLNSTYSFYRARSDSGGVELRMHSFELSPALYMDLFSPIWFLGAGPTAVKTNLKDETGLLSKPDDWALGAHGFAGVAWPLCPCLTRKGHRVALTAIVRYEAFLESEFGSAGGQDEIEVENGGWALRIGLSYLPDEGRRIVNWDWL